MLNKICAHVAVTFEKSKQNLKCNPIILKLIDVKQNLLLDGSNGLVQSEFEVRRLQNRIGLRLEAPRISFAALHSPPNPSCFPAASEVGDRSCCLDTRVSSGRQMLFR
jgi:hypothetical protein